jgi:hypothetical protein
MLCSISFFLISTRSFSLFIFSGTSSFAHAIRELVKVFVGQIKNIELGHGKSNPTLLSSPLPHRTV